MWLNVVQLLMKEGADGRLRTQIRCACEFGLKGPRAGRQVRRQAAAQTFASPLVTFDPDGRPIVSGGLGRRTAKGSLKLTGAQRRHRRDHRALNATVIVTGGESRTVRA